VAAADLEQVVGGAHGEHVGPAKPASDDIRPMREVPGGPRAVGRRRVLGGARAAVAGAAGAAHRPSAGQRSSAFTAIVFVLLTGVPWRMVPKEIGCSGVTAWRRLRDWQAAGVWERLHRELLRQLNAASQIDWSRAIVDSSQIRALQGGSDRALAG
jgi:transposase